MMRWIMDLDDRSSGIGVLVDRNISLTVDDNCILEM